MNQYNVISLGWGVQSWTIAAMAALGELPPVNVAVHSDTTFERADTYAFAEQWTPWLEARGVRVVMVSDPRAAHILKKSGTSDGHYTLMPVFTLDEVGKRGQLRRQCTSRWKIEPLHKWLGDELKRLDIDKTPGVVRQQLGITMDEWQRAKDSPVPWIKNTYPLLDRRMTRNDCLRWLEAHDLPTPGKSACVQCPFHSRAYWQEMKREDGPDWRAAVAHDARLRASGRPWYLHSDRKPLEEAVVLPHETGQGWLFDADNEPGCDSGHCFL